MKHLDLVWVLIKIVFAIVLGFLSYFTYEMGMNIEFFSKDNGFLWAGIIVCVLSMYLICFWLLRKDRFYLLFYYTIGVIISIFASRLGFSEKIAEDVWYKNKKPTKHPSIEPPSMTIDTKNCKEWKYGTFHYGADTITRFSKGNNDFEIINNAYDGKAMRIEWIDDCSYLKLMNTGQVLSKVNIGDFEYNQCTLFYFNLDQSDRNRKLFIKRIEK